MLSILGAFQSLPYVAIVVCALGLWNVLLDNPAQRREARQGMVLAAELSAAKAELAERNRQALAASAAADALRGQVAKAEAEQATRNAAAEEEIKAYEAKLAAAGRACILNDDDMRFIDGLRK